MKTLPTEKAKPCQVLRERRSGEISLRTLGSPVNPVNDDEREKVVQTSKQLVKPDSNSKPDILKRVDENVPKATRKLK